MARKRHQHTPCGDLLAEGSLPLAGVLEGLKARPDMADLVASNPAPLAPGVWEHLYGTKPVLPRAHKLLGRPELDAGHIDHIVAVGDTRPGIVTAVLREWHLTAAQQRRLAAGKLSTEAADAMLSCETVSEKVKAAVVARASYLPRIIWLADAPLGAMDDDTAWALASDGVSGEHRAAWNLTRLLWARPALRSRATHHDNPLVVAAVAGLELSGPDQHVVAARIVSGELAAHGTARAVALIDHPGTDPELRRQLWAWAGETGQMPQLRRAGLAPPGWLPSTDGPLSDIEEPEVIDALLYRGPLSGFSRNWQWLELCSNPNLDFDQAQRLVFRLVGASILSAGDVALEGVVKLLARHPALLKGLPEDSHWVRSTERAKPGGGTTAAPRGRARRRRAAPRPAPARHREKRAVKVLGGGERYSSGERHFENNPTGASNLLSARLGEDRAAWEVAWSLMDSFAGNVAELADVALAVTGS